MKIHCKNLKIYTILFACALFFAACGNGKIENNSVALNQNNVNEINANFQSNNINSQNINADTEPDAEAKEDDKADFEGTAGIVDKKYDIKGAAILKEVRTAQHGNYDRVVFEFAGAEMPSYHIEYIDKPVRACGSGNVVPLAGDGWLEIRFFPANAHTEEGKPTVENRERAPNHKIIKELKSTCDFEANVEWVLGVSSPNKYRVLELKNPTRLVVDIKH